MGLYDDRLAELSESRRNRRVSLRRTSSSGRSPRSPSKPRSSSRASKTNVQSLLFGRSEGWTSAKAKAWAKSHGFRASKVDVTDQYIRIRQFDPQGFKVKRTVPFGRGIRAVVASGEVKDMAVVKASRRRKKKSPAKRPRRRRSKASSTRRPRRRKKNKVHASRPRRRRRARAAETGYMMAARKRRRPARRRVRAWRGDAEGHAKAARKGWRRKKRKSSSRGRRRGKRRTRAREVSYVAAPRRRRRRRVHANVVQASRRRRRGGRRMRARGLFEPKRGNGFGSIALMMGTAGLGFVLADGLDRFLSTYNPAGATRPTDKFTSDGSGTLANTLNVAARPDWMRAGASVGAVVVPALGSRYIRSPMIKASMEGLALGAGVSAFKLFWNNFLMPMLVGKDTSAGALQKSFIARLYPAEVSSTVNLKAAQRTVSSAGSGALSDGQTGVGAQDVGPFALSGESPYPDAAQALRREAGVQDQFPSVQNTWGTGSPLAGPGSDYPTAAQAMGTGDHGLAAAWQPGPPPGPGPGPQAAPHKEPECACLGDGDQFAGYLGDKQDDTLFSASLNS